MLRQVRIRNLRGIEDLIVEFNYPVAVIAGPNACGKTTVLMALACAYDVPSAGLRDFKPATLFPNFRNRRTDAGEDLDDQITNAEISYLFNTSLGPLPMTWRRLTKGGWNPNFQGQKGVQQPKREVIVRTLANLSNPAEVRSVLNIGARYEKVQEVTADLIAFAQNVLPFKYVRMSKIISGGRDLLVAERSDASGRYSEFHMSSGERAILRLSMQLSNLQNNLVLIDEVEAGLHPYTQQQLMLELQRLALRNDLQIVVTSHSPAVLESVPRDARIFLERSSDYRNVVSKPAYQDVLQRVLYGQSLNKLSIICEDSEAKAVLHGCLDVLMPKLGLPTNDILIGTDTGKNQFAEHIRAFGKVQQLDGTLFVLDGDARDLKESLQAEALKFGIPLEPLFLPGESGPEPFLWKALETNQHQLGDLLERGESGDMISSIMQRIKQAYANAADKQSNIYKNMMYDLAREFHYQEEDFLRLVARRLLQLNASPELKVFLQTLELAVSRWRR
ncbi:AAA family ATPase [Candidatus Electronema sp. PJ]|uniref:AAA family ATPase n=1 Tax=Candidatus Electronema sp. PJ TaxID=3401572 RepID=UPI003AA91B05